MKAKIIVLLILLVGSLIIYLSTTGRKRGREYFKEFYAANLHSRISFVGISAGAVFFKLNNKSKKYQFIPYTIKINDKSNFWEIAEKGDSISKPSFNDTLNLFKNGGKYL